MVSSSKACIIIFLPVNSRAQVLLVEWRQNRSCVSPFPMECHAGIVCSICSSEALFRRSTAHRLSSGKFSGELRHELYNRGKCLWKANLELSFQCLFSLFFFEGGQMFVSLQEFIFSSAFCSDLADHWPGKDLQLFSCHIKGNTVSSAGHMLVTRKHLGSFRLWH